MTVCAIAKRGMAIGYVNDSRLKSPAFNFVAQNKSGTEAAFVFAASRS
jgi:hypothetical protein